jgi:hypothetical protein
MPNIHDEYNDHQIQLREGETGGENLIDGKAFKYDQLPDGQYALHEYAYVGRPCRTREKVH